MKKIFTHLLSLNLTHAWIGFFLYSCLISLLVQFFILPILFPRFHIGNGLLDGGDWTFYQYKAIELSNVIREHGWSNWEMKPSGFGILGLMTAIYSFLGIYEPYLLIPIFSMLHSVGAISIVLLIEKLGVNRATSILSSIPFLIFPSSLMWVTQILKDIFSINGSLLILLGITGIFSLINKVNIKFKLIYLIRCHLLIFIGFVLIWIVRPYFVSISLIFTFVIFSVINFYFIFYVFKKKLNFLLFFCILFLQIILLTSVNQINNLLKKDYDENTLLSSIPSPVLKDDLIDLDSQDHTTLKLENKLIEKIANASVTDIEKIEGFDSELAAENYDSASQHLGKQSSKKLSVDDPKDNVSQPPFFKNWSSSIYLPTIIDNEFKKLYLQRIYFYQVQYKANSTFDLDIDLNSFTKLVLYAPRAAQIAFFSPFPSSWFAEHPSQLSKLMHLINGFEMIIIYFCFIGFIFSIVLWKRKIEFWIFVTFSFYYALIPTYALPNMGALIRYRYAAIMILVALGIGAILHIYSKKLYENNEIN